MSKISNLIEDGKWYIGNLHTHSTISDGLTPPALLAGMYRNNGYDFLAITDHRKYGIHEDLSTSDFLMLSGVELDVVVPGTHITHHIVGIGIPGENKYEHGHRFEYDGGKTEANELIKQLRDNGNIAIYAHPAWSLVTMESYDSIEGAMGMEIYNTGCQYEGLTGRGDAYYDRALWSVKKQFCFATDDSHQHQKDYFGGFIAVKSAAFTQKAIMDAIQAGSFIASQGPRITQFYIENNVAVVECTPCRTIAVMGDNIRAAGVNSLSEPVTRFEYGLNGGEKYIRAQCEDYSGKVAWTQPIYLS